jgi:hypothetical protein
LVIYWQMCMLLWWNDTDRGKQKCWDKSLSRCHIVHHKSLMDSPGIETAPSSRETNDKCPEHGRIYRKAGDLRSVTCTDPLKGREMGPKQIFAFVPKFVVVI